MARAASDLITVVAVCEFLLQALERLDDEIASGAPVVELRRFADEARAELERRRLNPMES